MKYRKSSSTSDGSYVQSNRSRLCWCLFVRSQVRRPLREAAAAKASFPQDTACLTTGVVRDETVAPADDQAATIHKHLASPEQIGP